MTYRCRHGLSVCRHLQPSSSFYLLTASWVKGSRRGDQCLLHDVEPCLGSGQNHSYRQSLGTVGVVGDSMAMHWVRCCMGL